VEAAIAYEYSSDSLEGSNYTPFREEEAFVLGLAVGHVLGV